MKLVTLKIFISAIVFLQISCSSTSKHNGAAPVSAANSNTEKPKAVLTKEPTQRETDDALTSALKSQNQDLIFKAATQRLIANSKDPRALMALATYHFKKNQDGAAEYFLTLAQAIQPNSPDISHALGLIYLKRKNEMKAIQAFRRAIDLNSSFAPAALSLGAIYMQHNDYSRAQPALEVAYRQYRKDPNVVNNYGAVLLATGQFAKADKVFREALKIEDANKQAVFNLAIVLIEFQNKYQEGLDFLNRLKFLGPLPEMRNKIVVLENKAKLALNQ